ncbi:hypothetical protein BDW22DRAFT_179295 [Trametopsis cervina]|nr:hypothetical protein BDW22DRAFT_179295 [Trametopsis cervina]
MVCRSIIMNGRSAQRLHSRRGNTAKIVSRPTCSAPGRPVSITLTILYPGACLTSDQQTSQYPVMIGFGFLISLTLYISSIGITTAIEHPVLA